MRKKATRKNWKEQILPCHEMDNSKYGPPMVKVLYKAPVTLEEGEDGEIRLVGTYTNWRGGR